MTHQQILNICQKKKIEFVHLQFSDLIGMVKSVTIPIKKLNEAMKNGIWFDGSSIEGFARIAESDMFLRPDLQTFALIPWEKNTARLICDIYQPDGQPFEGDPRLVLKKTLAEAKKMNYVFKVGPEVEFYLLAKNEEQNKIEAHDKAGYFDFSADLGAEIRQEMASALQSLGIEVETLHHEVGPGQHEIGFKYSDALTAADNVITLKYTLKAIAARHNLFVTFMPKPFSGMAGSGMHTHQSLFKGDKNIFFDPKDRYMLSKTAKCFIAGQFEHIAEMSLVVSPIINSYKRLVAGFEAPVYVAWARINRSALIRIPQWHKNKPQAARCELRSPDPSCNPYLAFSVMLAAGLDGIKRNLKLKEPIEENIYELNHEDRQKYEIKTLPENLGEAIKEFSRSSLMKKCLDQHVYTRLLEAKNLEWDSYRTQVTDWETKRYLENI